MKKENQIGSLFVFCYSKEQHPFLYFVSYAIGTILLEYQLHIESALYVSTNDGVT